MLWWRVQGAGPGLLQRNFSQNCAKKPVWYPLVLRGGSGEQWSHPGLSEMPPTPALAGCHSRTDLMAAVQGREWEAIQKSETIQKSRFILKKPNPNPTSAFLCPLPGAAISQERWAGKHFVRRLRGCSWVQEGTQSSNMGEKKDEPMVLNLMHVKISLWTSWQAGWWYETCSRLPSTGKAISSSSSGPVFLRIEENEQRRLRKA